MSQIPELEAACAAAVSPYCAGLLTINKEFL